MRWRVNSIEYAHTLSKKGYLRGYIKYGVFSYMAWYYGKRWILGKQPHEYLFEAPKGTVPPSNRSDGWGADAGHH